MTTTANDRWQLLRADTPISVAVEGRKTVPVSAFQSRSVQSSDHDSKRQVFEFHSAIYPICMPLERRKRLARLYIPWPKRAVP